MSALPWGECTKRWPTIKQPAMLEVLFHRRTRRRYLSPSLLCSAQIVPPLPKEVYREVNGEVYNFSGFAGKEERQKQQWQDRGGCFTSPATSQKSGRWGKKQGCTELAARCYIHTVPYMWRVQPPPMNSGEKDAFVQSQAKIPQPVMTSLPLEIKKIFLTWTDITSYSGRDGRWGRHTDGGFPFSSLLRRKSPLDWLYGISTLDQG